MSAYERELDGFPDALPGLELDRGWYSPRPPPFERHIVCAACGAAERLGGYCGMDVVRGQMGLWREGWRRDPPTQSDFCPACAPAHLTG